MSAAEVGGGETVALAGSVSSAVAAEYNDADCLPLVAIQSVIQA